MKGKLPDCAKCGSFPPSLLSFLLTFQFGLKKKVRIDHFLLCLTSFLPYLLSYLPLSLGLKIGGKKGRKEGSMDRWKDKREGRREGRWKERYEVRQKREKEEGKG